MHVGLVMSKLQSLLSVHLSQAPVPRHLLPLALPAQSMLTVHFSQSPIAALHLGRSGSNPQSIFTVHFEQSPTPIAHLGAFTSFASHSALLVHIMHISLLQIGVVAVMHCEELVHCTHLPAASQTGPPVAPVQVRPGLVQGSQRPLVVLHEGRSGSKLQSLLAVHLAQAPPAHRLPLVLPSHSMLAAQARQSPVAGWQTGLFTSKLQSLLTVHFEQLPTPTVHFGVVTSRALHCALVVHIEHISLMQMGVVPAAQSSEPTHCTHCPAASQTAPPLDEPAQFRPGVVHGMHRPVPASHEGLSGS